MFLINQEIERPKREVIEGFRELATENICDAMGRYEGMSALSMSIPWDLMWSSPSLLISTK